MLDLCDVLRLYQLASAEKRIGWYAKGRAVPICLLGQSSMIQPEHGLRETTTRPIVNARGHSIIEVAL